jgi:hypothetical protein
MLNQGQRVMARQMGWGYARSVGLGLDGVGFGSCGKEG